MSRMREGETEGVGGLGEGKHEESEGKRMSGW